MKLINSIEEMVQFQSSLKDESLAFVPTMGALHTGHLSLVEKSIKENQRTIVSIYLNETQFNDKKDLETYPSSLDEDLKILSTLGVDGVFLPNYSLMYPNDYRFRVVENKESLDLCGKDRPGHFDGVLTVVMKLLNIVSPRKAYFGEKDYQQLSLIKDMVESFFMRVEIVACPTERDSEGLALSSRNRKLEQDELEIARYFASTLKNENNLEVIAKKLKFKNIEIDYLLEKKNRRYAAVKIGNVRLIDNVEI